MLTDIQVESFKSVTDLSANVFKFVRMTAERTVAVHTALAQVTVGVQQNKPTWNATGSVSGTIDVKHVGRTSVFSSGVVAVGNKVAPTAAGLARVAASADHVAGIAVSASDGTAAQPMIDIIVTLGGAPLP